MSDRCFVLVTAVHPGVVDVDVRGIVSVKDRADHVVVVVDLRVDELCVGIILSEAFKLGLECLEVIVAARDLNADV